MIQRRKDPRLALEAREAIEVRDERCRQYFDGDVALQIRVVGAIHLAHAADANQRDDVVHAETGPDERSRCAQQAEFYADRRGIIDSEIRSGWPRWPNRLTDSLPWLT